MLVARFRGVARESGNGAGRKRTKRFPRDAEKREEEERPEDENRLAVRLLKALDHLAEIRVVLD
jgi:hypothetical protein